MEMGSCTPEETDRAASATMREWMGVPHGLNVIASVLESVATAWTSLLHGLFTPCSNLIPLHIQREIAKASMAKPLPPEILDELRSAMRRPFTSSTYWKEPGTFLTDHNADETLESGNLETDL